MASLFDLLWSKPQYEGLFLLRSLNGLSSLMNKKGQSRSGVAEMGAHRIVERGISEPNTQRTLFINNS